MKRSDLGRYALSICVAAAFLVGCGGSQPPIGAPGAMPQSSALQSQSAPRGDRGSWMLPGVKDEDLIYAAGFSNTYVLSYADGKLIAKIDGFGGYSTCSDHRGDVFVTENSRIVEFAHGGTTPIQTLDDSGYLAASCSVDPKTGNLAVTNDTGTAGNVAIYQSAQGSPEIYTDPELGSYYYCGYDDTGDLFIDGYTPGSTASSQFAELPAGASSFTNIAVTKSIYAGQIQWDGVYITVSNRGRPGKIYRLQVSGSTATVVGTTRLLGWDPHVLPQSWIKGDTFIAPTDVYSRAIGFWTYPSGGNSIRTISGFTGRDRLSGLAVSVAPQ